MEQYYESDPVLGINGDAQRYIVDVRVTTSPTDRYFTVSDASGVHALVGCTAVSDVDARCEWQQGKVGMSLRGGNDKITFGPKVRAAGYAGAGNDVMIGGSLADHLLGDGGNDVLRGRGGQDRLDGDRGRDKLFGGSGSDRLLGRPGVDVLRGGRGDDKLLAIDGRGDRVVDCGPGRDVALVDRGLDRPINCEKVRYKLPPGSRSGFRRGEIPPDSSPGAPW